MFAAVTVSSGKMRRTPVRASFPVLKGRAEKLYRAAYEKVGVDIDAYLEVVNASDKHQDDNRDFFAAGYRHAPYHDV